MTTRSVSYLLNHLRQYLLIDCDSMRVEVGEMTLIPCCRGPEGSPLVPVQYLRARCDIDSQFGTVVDNMERREMIWSYECRPWRGRFEISRGPHPLLLGFLPASAYCLIRARGNKRREMFSINLILRMTVVLYHRMEVR